MCDGVRHSLLDIARLCYTGVRQHFGLKQILNIYNVSAFMEDSPLYVCRIALSRLAHCPELVDTCVSEKNLKHRRKLKFPKHLGNDCPFHV